MFRVKNSVSNAISLPRLLYILRTAPCTGSNELIVFDEVVKSTLSKALNIVMDDLTWSQASLPVRWGGLGIRSAVSLAPSTYLASAAGATILLSEILPVRLHDSSDPSVTVAFDAWSAQVHPTALPPDDSSRVIQRRWDESCCKQKVSTLLSEAVDIDSKARLLACMNESAGSWLNALPDLSLG